MNSTNRFLISAATLPLLSGLAILSTVTQKTTELGQLSEELFRGDRLPILPFPETTDD